MMSAKGRAGRRRYTGNLSHIKTENYNLPRETYTPYFSSAVQFSTKVIGWADAGGWVSTRNRLPSGDTSKGDPKAKTFRTSNRL